MKLETKTITLRSEHHYGRRVPPKAVGEILRAIPSLVRKSIRMAFEGRSEASGRRPKWLSSAADVRFVDHDGTDDTVLYFETPTLGEAAHDLYEQQELWPSRPDPNDTGFDLAADVVQDVSANQRDSDRFDRGLLRALQHLGRGLNGTFQECLLTGHRYTREKPAVVDHSVIENAELLTRTTPKPRQVRIAGVLDMLRASTNTLAIKLQDASEVRAVYVQGDVADLHDLLKEQVVLMGKAIYRPSGNLLRVDAMEVRPMLNGDTFFTTIPEAPSARLDLREIELRQRRKRGIAAIIGRWPGDETDEQVEAALREIS